MIELSKVMSQIMGGCLGQYDLYWDQSSYEIESYNDTDVNILLYISTGTHEEVDHSLLAIFPKIIRKFLLKNFDIKCDVRWTVSQKPEYTSADMYGYHADIPTGERYEVEGIEISIPKKNIKWIDEGGDSDGDAFIIPDNEVSETKMNVVESLKYGDLKDCVLPFLSIDEYESKIDNNSIVVAFFCTDKNPAKDLNSYIQKSAITLLDTDVSPAPTVEGHYVVFVEILRSPKFFVELKNLLEDLETLVNIKMTDWSCKCFKHRNIYNFDIDRLQQIVDIHTSVQTEDNPEPEEDEDKDEDSSEEENKDHPMKKVKSEAILTYLKSSILDNATIDGEILILERYGKIKEYEIIDFDHIDELCEKYGLHEMPIRYEKRPLLREAEGFLGDNWELIAFDAGIIMSRNDSEYSIYVK